MKKILIVALVVMVVILMFFVMNKEELEEKEKEIRKSLPQEDLERMYVLSGMDLHKTNEYSIETQESGINQFKDVWYFQENNEKLLMEIYFWEPNSSSDFGYSAEVVMFPIADVVGYYFKNEYEENGINKSVEYITFVIDSAIYMIQYESDNNKQKNITDLITFVTNHIKKM